ncbi:hypothetical protein TNCV_1365431 [Trichonephila clavipes]|nr:hypothetical protein TNCV_1365431 [Trichonephila clavipes]
MVEKEKSMSEIKTNAEKLPRKAGRDDIPQSTSVLTKQSAGGGRGRKCRKEDGTAEGSKSIRLTFGRLTSLGTGTRSVPPSHT